VNYAITITTTAAKSLKKLPAPVRVRLAFAIQQLASDPRPPGCKKLVATQSWRIRVGTYRIIYEILEKKLIVSVIKIGHRRDVYN
jgi:mRNA interferase RelE/StbE